MKKQSKALHVFAILFTVLSILCVIGWFAFFMLHGLMPADVNFKFPAFYRLWIKPHITDILKFFLLKSYGLVPKVSKYFYLTYVGFGALIFMVFLAILSLFLLIKRNRKRYLPYFFIMAFSTVAVLEFVSFYGRYYSQYLVLVFHDKNVMGNVIFTWATFIFAVLAYLFTFLAVVLSLAYAKRFAPAKKQKDKQAHREFAPVPDQEDEEYEYEEGEEEEYVEAEEEKEEIEEVKPAPKVVRNNDFAKQYTYQDPKAPEKKIPASSNLINKPKNTMIINKNDVKEAAKQPAPKAEIKKPAPAPAKAPIKPTPKAAPAPSPVKKPAPAPVKPAAKPAPAKPAPKAAPAKPSAKPATKAAPKKGK